MIPWVTLFAISYILYFVSQKMFLQKIKLPFLTGSADIDLTQEKSFDKNIDEIVYLFQKSGKRIALMLDLRTDFYLPCKLIAEEHFLYDSIFTRI